VGFAAQVIGAFLAFATLTESQPVVRFAGALIFSTAASSRGIRAGADARRAVDVSTTVGWIQQWSSAGQVAGPPVVAWIATALGGWQ
jgi:hypothetical protein